MKFEIINSNGKIVFNTMDESCLPTKGEINSMTKVGYKFKIDGKSITKKKLEEIINMEENLKKVSESKNEN